MKKSVILDIFNGVRGQQDTMYLPKERLEKMAVFNTTYNSLKEKLSPELVAEIDKLINENSSYWEDEVDFHYTEGFKLGILIGIECMEN